MVQRARKGTVCAIQCSRERPHASDVRITDNVLDEFIEIYKEEFQAPGAGGDCSRSGRR